MFTVCFSQLTVSETSLTWDPQPGIRELSPWVSIVLAASVELSFESKTKLQSQEQTAEGQGVTWC